MPCSEARLEANRRNAAKSTGPRTPEGKETARENSLKHGLTGAGVVVPEADRAEVDRLARQLEAELAPVGSTSGRLLARRAAALSVRLDRCFWAEEAVTADRVRHAATAYDEDRQSTVDHLWATAAISPSTNARRLRATPEGVDLLLGLLTEMRLLAADPAAPAWDPELADRFDLITGRRPDDPVQSTCRLLSVGYFHVGAAALPVDEGGPDAAGWRAYALGGIVALIDAEVAALREHRETLDHAAIAQSRAEAGQRALVDPGPAASTCRRYEAAAERGFFRALAELRQLHAEAAAPHPGAPRGPVAPPPPPVPPAARPATGPLGSFFPGPAAPPWPGHSSAFDNAFVRTGVARPAMNPARPPG